MCLLLGADMQQHTPVEEVERGAVLREQTQESPWETCTLDNGDVCQSCANLVIFPRARVMRAEQLVLGAWLVQARPRVGYKKISLV